MEFSASFESAVIATVLGGAPQPPVDLIQVAEDVGVRGIRSTQFRDGFTDFGHGGPFIYLNQTEAGPRMRFVLAHELAHVMLRQAKVIRLIKSVGRSDLLYDEESLASRIAAVLLTPDSWVENFRGDRFTPARLEYLANNAQVSLMMLVGRMSSAAIDIALLHWRRQHRSWHVIDRPGVPASLYGRLELSQVGRRAIDALTSVDAQLFLDATVSGRTVGISGVGCRRGADVIQIIKPTRDVHFF